VLLGPWSFARYSGCHLFISFTARDRLALEPRTLELTMAKKERNQGSAGRARAKRGTTPSSAEYMDEVSPCRDLAAACADVYARQACSAPDAYGSSDG
jgi:hypothetical protein